MTSCSSPAVIGIWRSLSYGLRVLVMGRPVIVGLWELALSRCEHVDCRAPDRGEGLQPLLPRQGQEGK